MFNSSIVRQPDGKHALYDHKSNTFTITNATITEIRDQCVQAAIARIDADIITAFTHIRASHMEGNDDPLYKAALESVQDEEETSIINHRDIRDIHTMTMRSGETYATDAARTQRACQR